MIFAVNCNRKITYIVNNYIKKYNYKKYTARKEKRYIFHPVSPHDTTLKGFLMPSQVL
ncbi:MAG: hypothetical protein RL181_2475 [Bacteroidota bacterium]